MLRVRRYRTCFALHGPWSGGLTSMHTAPVPVCDNGVLAGCSLSGFSEAPLARPFGPEPLTTAGFNELFSVN